MPYAVCRQDSMVSGMVAEAIKVSMQDSVQDDGASSLADGSVDRATTLLTQLRRAGCREQILREKPTGCSKM